MQQPHNVDVLECLLVLEQRFEWAMKCVFKPYENMVSDKDG